MSWIDTKVIDNYEIYNNCEFLRFITNIMGFGVVDKFS